MDQVLTVPKTALLSKPEMESIALQVKNRSRIILIGCGTAAYCALASQYFFAQVGLEAKSYGAYEFLPFSGFSMKKTVILLFLKAAKPPIPLSPRGLPRRMVLGLSQ